MVVRLNLEGASPPTANVDDPGVLAGSLQHAWALGRQPLQQQPRALIAAVLAPHHAEDAQLRQRRLAPQQPQDLFVLFGSDLMMSDQVGGDRSHESLV